MVPHDKILRKVLNNHMRNLYTKNVVGITAHPKPFLHRTCANDLCKVFTWLGLHEQIEDSFTQLPCYDPMLLYASD